MSGFNHLLASCLATVNGVSVGIVMLNLDQSPSTSAAFAVITGLLVLAVQHGTRRHLQRLSRSQG